MSDALNNPANNFTVSETQPAGLRIPEFVIRQLISWALGQIRSAIGTPNDVIDQLFALVPVQTRNTYKQWLLDNTNIYLDVGWPQDPVSIAMVVVEPQSEQEDTSNAFLGDAIGETEFQGPNGAPWSAPAYAIPEQHTTNIYIASDNSRLTLFLYETIKFILVSNKANLTKFWDMHNLSISGGVLDLDSDKLPQFTYYRVMVLSYQTLFDFNGPASGPAIVNVALIVDAFNGKIEVDTTVEPIAPPTGGGDSWSDGFSQGFGG